MFRQTLAGLIVAALATPVVAADKVSEAFQLVDPGFTLWQTDQSGSSFYRMDEASGIVETIELPGNGDNAALTRTTVFVPVGQKVIVRRESGQMDRIAVTLTISRTADTLKPVIETDVAPVGAATAAEQPNG